MWIACTMSPGRGATDIVMQEAVMRLLARGIRLAGTVQTNTERAADPRCDMDVRVLPEGPVFRISQDLGRDARGCRLNPEGLEGAVAAVSAAMEAERPDLLIVNKFGKHECLGRGFRPVIAEAVAADIPVLVGVNALNLPELQGFVGDGLLVLPPDPEAILRWAVNHPA